MMRADDLRTAPGAAPWQLQDLPESMPPEFVDGMLVEDRGYWLEKLAGPLPASSIPLDFVRPTPQFFGAKYFAYSTSSRDSR